MQAKRELPPGYTLHSRLSIKNRATLIWMNIIGLVLLVFFAWLFTAVAVWLRPDQTGLFFKFTFTSWQSLAEYTAIALLVIFFVLALHEAIHGLGFWLLARVRPEFAFKGLYAYAAAPGCYIPRNPYLVIGLGPLVVISLAAVGLLAFVPAQMIFWVILAAILNASGAVGDIWVAVLLLRQPADALSLDSGDEISIYAPAR
jgi:hypothetical protein